MTREQQVKINFSFTWLVRVLLTGLVSVVLYFVLDIHQDFKQVKNKVESIEIRLVKAETDIFYINPKIPNHE